MSGLRLIYATTADPGQAASLARRLVEEGLAACANLIPGMRSCYRWQGAVEEGEETVLILKTREELVDRLVSRLCELHPYEVPCALVLPVLGGNPAYLDWLRRETQGPAQGP